MSLDEQIQEQTNLIKTLEGSYPERKSALGRYHEDNLPWEIHHTELRDAYWRRRMLIAKRDGLDEVQTAKVY